MVGISLSQNDDESNAKRSINIVFLVIYSITLIIFSISSYKTIKYKENRTIQTVFTIIFILLTLLSKIFIRQLFFSFIKESLIYLIF